MSRPRLKFKLGSASQGESRMSARENLAYFYPEIGAGGFSHVDGTINFYNRINALIEPHFTVLDLGAGRGQQIIDNPCAYRAELCKLQGKVAKIVGADVDDAVLENPCMDETVVFDPAEPLPFKAESFDLIYSDWVLEHVADPESFVADVERILKPGGWFCARTPNRIGITGVGANLVPNRMHVKLLGHLQKQRKEVDVFPTVYKLNSRGAIRRYFPASKWENHTYLYNPEPPYVQNYRLAMYAVFFAWRALPPAFSTVLNIFVRKKA